MSHTLRLWSDRSTNRSDDYPTTYLNNEDESWNGGINEGENALSLMGHQGTCRGSEGGTEMSSFGGFTYAHQFLHQSTTYPSVSAAWSPHQPLSSSNIWDDNVSFGSLANSDGQTVSFQSLPTTTLPLQVSQAGDNFDFSDLNHDFSNDFLLFEDGTEFSCHSYMSFSPEDMTM